MDKLIFSQTSLTGIVPEGKTKESAIADGLHDWACIMMGAKAPENFGKGMAAASSKFGIIITPGNLEKLADDFLQKTPK